eukprot:scaffold239142_cov35-Tisochrysis_lutea.AAC.6
MANEIDEKTGVPMAYHGLKRSEATGSDDESRTSLKRDLVRMLSVRLITKPAPRALHLEVAYSLKLLVRCEAITPPRVQKRGDEE